jgi:hypothetical protein
MFLFVLYLMGIIGSCAYLGHIDYGKSHYSQDPDLFSIVLPSCFWPLTLPAVYFSRKNGK